MISKDIESELERNPFIPLRLHLVSGKIIPIPTSGVAWLMQNSLLVFQNAKPGKARVGGYDLIALRNIERLEQVGGRRRNGARE